MLSTVMASTGALAADTATASTTNLTAEQKKEVEKIVHDYLVTSPEVLIEASQALQQKQQKDMQDQVKGAINTNANELITGKLSVAGNPKGSVTLVEFFDYQCVHCKKMAPVVDALIKKDSNLRVVYKEFPIFGGSSELASQAALAAAMQGKYAPFHDALLKQEKRLDEKTILSIAKSVGLNTAKLQKDMKSKEILAEVDATRKLAEKLHLMGTPAFMVLATPNGVVNAQVDPVFIPGAASLESLQEIINKMTGK